jgi:aminoglycoside phosphotransferase (APT) family kinase protein
MNVVVRPADGSVLAVLDWELCTLGDPLADLGGLLANWPRPGDPAGAVCPAPALPGFLSREDLAAAYARETGRSLETLPFWHVLGLWKIAIIAEGVFRRAQDHPGNAPPAATARTVDDLIVRALSIAEQAGW